MKLLLSTYLFLSVFCTAFSQSHTIVIHSNQRVASLQMTPAEYQSWVKNDDFNNDAKRQALVSDIYKKFSDKFDFIFLVLNEATQPSNLYYAGQLISVSNNVQGIGIPQFSLAGKYGSAGKLKSVMALTRKDYLLYGPSLHELMHNWGNFLIDTRDWNGSNEYAAQPHWGFTGGNTQGQLGGFLQSSLQTNVGGKVNNYAVAPFGGFANGGNSVPYTDLELYLMGMVPITTVKPFDVFRGLSAATYNATTKMVEFSASQRVTYDNSKILADGGGPRNPSNASSIKNFRLLYIVLTPAPLSDADWAAFDNQSDLFSRKENILNNYVYNFWSATRGLGSIQTGSLQDAVKTGLPLQLLSLTAEADKDAKTVNIQWQTAGEINTGKFVVQRSNDGRNFNNIGTVAAAGQGNNAYHYNDGIAALNTPVIYYRLNSVDKDGTGSYSKIVAIDIKAIQLMQVYPNPAKSTLYVKGDGIKNVLITGLNGQVLISKSMYTAGTPIDISRLARGIYTVQFAKADGSKISQKLVIE